MPKFDLILLQIMDQIQKFFQIVFADPIICPHLFGFGWACGWVVLVCVFVWWGCVGCCWPAAGGVVRWGWPVAGGGVAWAENSEKHVLSLGSAGASATISGLSLGLWQARVAQLFCFFLFFCFFSHVSVLYTWSVCWGLKGPHLQNNLLRIFF